MINPEVYRKLPIEVQDELSKVKFDPITERDNELKSSASQSVKRKVIKILVEEELDRRVSCLQKGFKLLSSTKDEYVNIKPDIKPTFSKDMEESPSSYSYDQAQKKKGTFKKLVDLVLAINLATESSEFDQLEKLVK